MVSPSEQQTLAYERLKDMYGQLIQINKQIADRTSVVVGGGTALATAFGAAKFLNGAVSGAPLWLLVASIVVSLVVFVLASVMWSPYASKLPGTTDLGLVWDEVIDVSYDKAYANVMQDLAAAIESERKANDTRAVLFRVLVGCVWLQISVVLLAVASGS